MTKQEALVELLLRKADDSLILGHRLSEWCGHGPILEEDIALTNIALDLVGQATELYKYAAETEGKGRTEDDLAYLRLEREYKNVLLVEQTNGDFGKTMARQFFFDHFEVLFFDKLQESKDNQIAAIASKTVKEVRYHAKHSSEWMIRLGDGTEESHQRIQASVNDLYCYVEELFFQDETDKLLIAEGIIPDVAMLFDEYNKNIKAVIEEATLTLPSDEVALKGGRNGIHSEHLGYLLAELQYMQRAYPGMEW